MIERWVVLAGSSEAILDFQKLPFPGLVGQVRSAAASRFVLTLTTLVLAGVPASL
jgi:hypothetical protein